MEYPSGRMNDEDIREICNRFFDAYQDRRTDELAELYSDDVIIWHNCFGRDTTKEDNLKGSAAGYAMQRRRMYNDRQIDTFDGGFVIRYTLEGVQHSGFKGGLSVCIVGRCRDGKITRIDEYIDTGKFTPEIWRGPDYEKHLAANVPAMAPKH